MPLTPPGVTRALSRLIAVGAVLRGPLPGLDAWLGDVRAAGVTGTAGAGWFAVVATLSALIIAGWVGLSDALFVVGTPPATPVAAIAGVTVVGTVLGLLMGDGD